MYNDEDDDESVDQKENEATSSIKKFLQKPQMKVVYYTSENERNTPLYNVTYQFTSLMGTLSV